MDVPAGSPAQGSGLAGTSLCLSTWPAHGPTSAQMKQSGRTCVRPLHTFELQLSLTDSAESSYPKVVSSSNRLEAALLTASVWIQALPVAAYPQV
jgi:hypothetical protein